MTDLYIIALKKIVCSVKKSYENYKNGNLYKLQNNPFKKKSLKMILYGSFYAYGGMEKEERAREGPKGL